MVPLHFEKVFGLEKAFCESKGSLFGVFRGFFFSGKKKIRIFNGSFVFFPVKEKSISSIMRIASYAMSFMKRRFQIF